MAQYIDEFLKDRPRGAREEFRSRTIERQYSSIIQWRRNRRIRETTPRDCAEILDTLAKVRSMIENTREISEADCGNIHSSLNSISTTLDEYMRSQKARKIEELEQQSRRISEELQELRGY